MSDPLVDAIDVAISEWWGSKDPRPTLQEAIAQKIRAGECWDHQWCCVHEPPVTKPKEN